jgi:hypothetical protein
MLLIRFELLGADYLATLLRHLTWLRFASWGAR